MLAVASTGQIAFVRWLGAPVHGFGGQPVAAGRAADRRQG